ncbi:MAG: sortase [Caldilineaceae bacterium]
MKLKVPYLVLGTLLLTLSLVLLVQGSTMAAPVFTGNAADDFKGPNVIKISDLEGDVGMPSPDFPRSARSGWDMRAVYLEYDQANDTLYVGVDCIVICGDADGDGDPNVTGPILGKPVSQGGLGGKDVADFGPGESFGLIIDTNNDFNGTTGNFEVVVGVKNSDSLAQLGAYGYTGQIGSQLRNTGWGAKLPNAVTLFAPPSAGTPDLEFAIANFSTLPGFPNGQPIQSYKVQMAMGSIVDDGIGEDYAPGQQQPIDITPTPTPPPTDTATAVPTDTPTTAPTDTPTSVPTETATITPTETATSIPTDTPTVTPTATLPATPTPPAPTETPTELPPTGVPTSGANLSEISPVEALQIPIVAKQKATGQIAVVGQPTFLRIPAIDLATAVEAMGWRRVVGVNGAAYSEWEDIQYAAGWQKNSALPGTAGNVVLNGHNNIDGAVFRDLWKVTAGETIYVYANQKQYTYKVDSVQLRPEINVDAAERAQTAALIRQSDDHRLTLISCWPPNSNTHRVFVQAHLVQQTNAPAVEAWQLNR